MVKLAERAYDKLILSVNYWIISLAVSRASEQALGSADGSFVDYML